MSRPVDWWVLDLEGDPTPGSPAAVRRTVRSWSGLADDAEYAERRIGQLLGDEALGSWIGEAGDAFRSKTGDLPSQLGRCKVSYRQASEALGWWADRLETHQSDADAAEWQMTTHPGGLHVTNPQATHVVEATLPPGATVYQGPAGPQTGTTIPGHLEGGGEQIYVPQMPADWLTAGIRRLQP